MLRSASSLSASRRLAGTFYAYAFLSELVLFYPVAALLFRDTGLTVAQISTLFVIWTLASVLLEVPSGALADTVSRRLLLTVAPLLAAVGFALWALVPSYPAFAAGFVLWGAGGALVSGTMETLVWNELDRLGATDRYTRMTGRARTAEVAGAVVAAGLAGPVLAAGGHPAVGAGSVLACLLAAAAAARLPESPATRSAGPDADVDAEVDGSDLGWLGNLRAGLTEARRDPRVRGAALLVPAVTALWGALDEYAPLLAVEIGVPEPAVPPLLLLAWAGVGLGGLLAPAAQRLGEHAQPVLLAVAALALAGGAALGHPAGFALVAVAFGAFQVAGVLAEASLQARITGPSRATVTSLAGMATDLTLLVAYVGYAVAATASGHRGAFVLAAGLYLVLAALLLARSRRWGPAVRGGTGRSVAHGRLVGDAVGQAARPSLVRADGQVFPGGRVGRGGASIVPSRGEDYPT